MLRSVFILCVIIWSISCSRNVQSVVKETPSLTEPEQLDSLHQVMPVEELTDDSELYEKAQQLAHQFIITDGHVDLPYRLKVTNFKLEKEYLGIPIETEKGDFDYVRAKEGGLDAPFMSIYLPSALQEEKGESKKLADSLITMVEGITMNLADKFSIAYSPQHVQKIVNDKMIALPMGMENGSGIEDDLDNIDYFKKRGISYITLTHAKDNLICDSSYDTTRTWNGLSEYGELVVKRMNEVGIMVDISHVSDSTFYQVIEKSKVPVIASHSSLRHFVPGFERNMSDDMVSKLKENGGVIMINFGSTFVDGEARTSFDKHRKAINALLEARGFTQESDEGKELIENYRKTNPTLFADVERVADHIDRVVNLAGIYHVGFGSDYDGVGDSLPTGLKDVSAYPNLIYELLKRGYTEDDIEKICYKNLFRVWQAALDYAESSDGNSH